MWKGVMKNKDIIHRLLDFGREDKVQIRIRNSDGNLVHLCIDEIGHYEYGEDEYGDEQNCIVLISNENPDFPPSQYFMLNDNLIKVYVNEKLGKE